MPEAADTATAATAAVHSLDSYEMEVPNLEEAHRFYHAFGLAVERERARLLLRTLGSDHVWGEIVTGQRKALLSLRFGIYERDLPVFRTRFSDDADSDSNMICIRAPDGLAIRLVVAPKSAPDAKPPFALADRFTQGRGAGPRTTVIRVQPRRLAHVALFTPHVQTAIDFYGAKLGLRLSDRSGCEVAFMHGPHGSDHHLIALAHSSHPGLHHSSWDVGTLDEVGQGAMQMAKAGYVQGWGLGRHVLGSNYFFYVRDPWNSYAEYSADMDYIPAGATWQCGDHPAQDSFYQWGPTPPEDFSQNYEIIESTKLL
jgi:catechol 2,3-dioxygenase-like lactoylglutathione lyase family enzyme